MAKFRYSLNAGVSWTTIDAALPFSIPSTASQDVLVEPIGPAVLNEKPGVVVTAPGAFTLNQWTVADNASGGSVKVTISALPSDGGSAITAIQYKVGTGAWTNSGIAGTGNFNITGLTNGTAVNVLVRAVNAAGNGADSDTKSVTPTAAVVLTALEPAGSADITDAGLVHRSFFFDLHHPTYTGPTVRLVRSVTAGSQDFSCDPTTKRFNKAAVNAWAGNEDVKLVGFIDQCGSGEIWNAVGTIYVRKDGAWYDAGTAYDEATANLTRIGQGGACAWLGDGAGHMEGQLTGVSAAQGLEFHYALVSEERKRAANATDPLGIANNTAEHYFSAGVSNTVKILHSLLSGGTSLHTASLDLDSASSADTATYSGYIIEQLAASVYSYVMTPTIYQLWENRRACTSKAVPSAHQTALAAGSMDNLKYTVGGVIGASGVITRTSGANISLYGLMITKPLTSEQRFPLRERVMLGMMQHRAKGKDEMLSRLDELVLFRKANPVTGVLVGEKNQINIQIDVAANEGGTPNWSFNDLSSYGVRGLYAPDNQNRANSWEETTGFWPSKEKGTMIAIGALDPTGNGGTYGSNLSTLFRHTTGSRFSTGNVACSLSLGWDHNAPVLKTGPGNARGSISTLISTRKLADESVFGGVIYDGPDQWSGKYNDKLSPTLINFDNVYNNVTYSEAGWANLQPAGFPYVFDAPVRRVNPRNQQIVGKIGYLCSMIGTFDNGAVVAASASDAEWRANRLTCKTTFYISYGKAIGHAQANYNIKNEMPLVQMEPGSKLKSNHFLQSHKGHIIAFAFAPDPWDKVKQEEWALNEYKFLIAA